MERLTKACAIIARSVSDAVESLEQARRYLQKLERAYIVVFGDFALEDEKHRDVWELLQTIEGMKETACLADYADDLNEIIPSKTLPRPPKRIRPVNKANYTYNRPQKRARSSCYIIKR